MQSLRRSLLARRPAAASFPSRRTPAPAPRHFQTSSRCLARKDAQGKDDINTESNEYSKSGSDDKSSAVEEAAFSPDKTSPEEQQAHAEGEANEQGKINNPLEVSPANHDVSQPRGGEEGGHEGSSAQSGQGNSDRARTSGGGGGPKSGGGKSGGGT